MMDAGQMARFPQTWVVQKIHCEAKKIRRETPERRG
jgi:hypothetical protein